MQYIKKLNAPEELNKYKRKKGASFDDLSSNHYDIKQCIREFLLIEQGYICCYCGNRVDLDTSVIEHLKDKDHHPELQLDYMNLSCSCQGGQTKRSNNPQYPLSCDANKGNKEIYIFPTDIECGCKFEFDDQGNIYGVDEDAEKTIRALNLNNTKLNNMRKAAIDAYRYYGDDDIDWSEEIQLICSCDEELKFIPFNFVVRYYIENYRLTN